MEVWSFLILWRIRRHGWIICSKFQMINNKLSFHIDFVVGARRNLQKKKQKERKRCTKSRSAAASTDIRKKCKNKCKKQNGRRTQINIKQKNEFAIDIMMIEHELILFALKYISYRQSQNL